MSDSKTLSNASVIRTTITLPSTLSCLIFDWDGTLVDSSRSVILAHQHALEALKLPHASADALHGLLGHDKDQVCAALTKNSDVTPDAYYQRFNYYYHVFCDQIKLFSDSLAILTLAKKYGLKLALATNKTSEIVHAELEKTGVSDCFDYMAFANLSVAKPDPTMLNNSIACFGLSPDQCLMIGDQRADIDAARAACVKSITLVDMHTPSWATCYYEMTTFCRHSVFLQALRAIDPT
tara:strand:+ start:691 stop:1401 length:711 start_codon:yes stop_codon:yes gene_type:complete